MLKIDAHNHPDYHGMNFERFIADADACGIDKTILLSWEAPASDYDPMNLPYFGSAYDSRVITPFSRCWDFYEKAPERFLLGYAPDPRIPGAILKLKSAVNTYRVQVCGEFKLRMMYNDPDAIDLFRAAGEMGLPVTLHFDYPEAQLSHAPYDYPRRHWWYGGDMDTLESMLRLCPETNFLGHAPGFWCHISDDEKGFTEAYPTGPVIPGGRIEKLLDRYPNLYCDCSAGSCLNALQRDPEYTRKLILAHPDHFVYARDMFGNELSPFIDSLGLPEDVFEKFYHGNIERLLPAVADPQ